MTSNLKKYFPAIREKKEVLADIHANKELLEKFDCWTKEHRKNFWIFVPG